MAWGGSNSKALTAVFLLPFKEMPAFCGTVAEMESLSSLVNSKFFLIAIKYHPLILVPLTGVTWDQQTMLEFSNNLQTSGGYGH